MPATEASMIRVPLTAEERANLKRIAKASHRTLGGQAAVIIGDWLRREERKHRARAA